jgi:hypothetical protein
MSQHERPPTDEVIPAQVHDTYVMRLVNPPYVEKDPVRWMLLHESPLSIDLLESGKLRFTNRARGSSDFTLEEVFEKLRVGTPVSDEPCPVNVFELKKTFTAKLDKTGSFDEAFTRAVWDAFRYGSGELPMPVRVSEDDGHCD